MAPAGSLDADDGEVVGFADATVLPGFVDAHVHVDQWVHRTRRVDVSAAGSAAEVVGILRAHRDEGGAKVLTGHGYVDGLWPEPAHRRLLDDAFAGVPVAVVSNDLHTAWLNGAALAAVGRGDHPTGLLQEQDCMLAVRALMDLEQPDTVDRWVAKALTGAAALGVTGLVDFEYADNVTVWRRRTVHGPLAVQVAASVWLPWLDQAATSGLRTGDPLSADGSAVVGPFKLMADGSLNARTAFCHDPYDHAGSDEPYGIRMVSTEELVRQLTRAAEAGLAPAVHAIGDAANSAVLDAFEKVGCHGRIEHAQLVRDDDLPRFAAAGVIASVQPQHAVADRDVADRHWHGRTARAFPYAALLAAGAELRFGSDAPVSPLDPWAAVTAAVTRTDDKRPPWHPEQALPLGVALAAAADGRQAVVPGMTADLAVAEGDVTGNPEELRRTRVLLTLRGGRTTHRAC